MARDPDAQMVVFKDTRGRRTTSQKIRDWLHVIKGAEGTGRAVGAVVRGIGEAALFGGLVYLGRPKLYVYVWDPARYPVPTYRALYSPDGTQTISVTFSFLSKLLERVDLGHPDAALAETIGQLTLLTVTEEPGLLGIIETAGGMAIYHTLLNGLNPGDPGFFASRNYTPDWLRDRVQASIDTFAVPWPIPNLKKVEGTGQVYVYPVDSIILGEYLPRWLYDLTHATFLDLLIHRKLGVSAVE